VLFHFLVRVSNSFRLSLLSDCEDRRDSTADWSASDTWTLGDRARLLSDEASNEKGLSILRGSELEDPEPDDRNFLRANDRLLVEEGRGPRETLSCSKTPRLLKILHIVDKSAVNPVSQYQQEVAD
jgi:hypothetical protein